jgi:hypothetical protein
MAHGMPVNGFICNIQPASFRQAIQQVLFILPVE